MALTIGTDSYISLAAAETYITENYISTETKPIAWALLTNANKEILLRRAAKLIDRQPLVGIKAGSTQAMEFPRAIYTDYKRRDLPIITTHFDSDWYVQTETPDAVKYAQVEIALTATAATPKRVELQQQGVKSFSLGKLSESYGSGQQNAIVSQEAKEYLKPYLVGSVGIV